MGQAEKGKVEKEGNLSEDGSVKSSDEFFSQCFASFLPS
jgi:hypothetical protein